MLELTEYLLRTLGDLAQNGIDLAIMIALIFAFKWAVVTILKETFKKK